MAMKRTFCLTLILFLFVWAFSAIDRIGNERVKTSCLNDQANLFVKLTPAEVEFLANNPEIQAQVEEIDRKISELRSMKRGYEARALRHEDQAQRLQFEDRAVLETRRHNELADENRQKADKIQQEIDRLQAERRKLLQSG